MRIKSGLRFLAMTIAMTVMTAAFSIQAFAAGALASVNGTEDNTL